MPLIRSWIESANSPDTDFPLNNLPLGVFSIAGGEARCGVAVGDMILDCAGLEAAGLLRLADDPVLDVPFWNEVMELGPDAWARLRVMLLGFLAEGSVVKAEVEPHLVRQADADLHMPFLISEFTDFYSGRNHARNVAEISGGGLMSPNWEHMPIAYNGRASSVVVSGTEIIRPNGQLRPKGADAPYFGPSRRFDFELELGAIVGRPSDGMVSVAEADAMIFGYVLLNDWSARDIQGWEYQPLGPFQSKATATSISPWIVMRAALEPFRRSGPARETPLLPYLAEPGPLHYDIALEAALAPEGKPATVISRTVATEVYYSAAQQLAHHTSSGCPMNVGDLLGSGTISGPERNSSGSLLELSWGGREPITLASGETRKFIEDGDTVILRGRAQADGYRVGFGSCEGKLRPARPLPGWAG